MKHCKDCNVDVNSTEKYCPLCFNELEEVDEKGNAYYTVTHVKPRTITNNHMLSKVFFLLSICLVGVCAVINILTHTEPWSVIVAMSFLYVWIFVRHTILSSRNIFEKILFQLVGIIGLLLTTNLISGGGLWFAEFVLPSIELLALLVLDFMLIVSKKRKYYLLSFFLIDLILLVSSIIFVSINYCDHKIMHIITLFVTALSMLGIILFGGKSLRQEFLKKFHL